MAGGTQTQPLTPHQRKVLSVIQTVDDNSGVSARTTTSRILLQQPDQAGDA